MRSSMWATLWSIIATMFWKFFTDVAFFPFGYFTSIPTFKEITSMTVIEVWPPMTNRLKVHFAIAIKCHPRPQFAENDTKLLILQKQLNDIYLYGYTDGSGSHFTLKIITLLHGVDWSSAGLWPSNLECWSWTKNDNSRPIVRIELLFVPKKVVQ